MTKEEEKVWKELENMGWSNKPEDMHLEYFQDIIKATKKALAISRVSNRRELLRAYENWKDFEQRKEDLKQNISWFLGE